jgi:type II secretory pathway pseudopilin PulG
MARRTLPEIRLLPDAVGAGQSHPGPVGFTLVEVLVSMALVVALAIGVAHLLAVALVSGRAARDHSSAVILAGAKLEQLRSLLWSYEPGAIGQPPMPRSDFTTNLSVEPATGGGGPGLRQAPTGTLDANTSMYVDYLDAAGRWVGTGPSPPSSALFIRRWAVHPLPEDPDRTLILQVRVTTVRREATRRTAPSSTWTGEDALLVTMLTRKSR